MINTALPTVDYIRTQFATEFANERFTVDKTGVKTVELIGVSFIANDDTIFGKVNDDYVSRELDWYLSRDLNVAAIPGKTPKIWEQVSSDKGEVNSNYGYLALSKYNGSQYKYVLEELKRNKDSRRAIMIYTRPTMHTDYNRDGMSDFVCTNTVQYFIRNHKVHCVVNMRSNDAWAGYRNDYAWQNYMLNLVTMELYGAGFREFVGDIIWQVGSLHVYENQFYLLEYYSRTGDYRVTKDEVKNYWDTVTGS